MFCVSSAVMAFMPVMMAVAVVPVPVLGAERAGGFQVSGEVCLNGLPRVAGRAHNHIDAEIVQLGDGAAADAAGNDEPDARRRQKIGDAAVFMPLVADGHATGDLTVFRIEDIEIGTMPEMWGNAPALACYCYFHNVKI